MSFSLTLCHNGRRHGDIDEYHLMHTMAKSPLGNDLLCVDYVAMPYLLARSLKITDSGDV